MERFKLVSQNYKTWNDTDWRTTKWKETSGEGGRLCTKGWLHCYTSPELAVIMNPIHADIDNPRMLIVKVEGKTLDDYGLKEGWTRMRRIKEIAVPEITLVQKVAFGVYCALEGSADRKFIKWANDWLSGKDRSAEAAWARARATAWAWAEEAARAAARAAKTRIDFDIIIKKAMAVK